MKTRIIKSLLTLVMAVMALPMLSQDFMNIYLKNGSHRQILMRDVVEITSSKMDSKGVIHSEYESQQIKTLLRDYYYNLSEIDSITFSKYHEEIAKENVQSSMSKIIPLVNNCESLADVEAKIDEIKNTKGVDDVWSDGHLLHIKIDEWHTISFDFDHEDSAFYDEDLDNIKQAANNLARSKIVVKQDDSKLKAVIANQQHYDESRKDFVDGLYLPLKDYFNDCGINAIYIQDPSVEFFKSEIFDYDIVFLITHGGYDSDTKTHSFFTSDVFGMVEKDPEEEQQPDYTEIMVTEYDDLLKKYHASPEQIGGLYHEETRDGKPYWVCYALLKENFFAPTQDGGIADNNNTNPNSIIFNTACQSLKGTHSLADKFLEHGFGAYLGYNETNSVGKRAGTRFYKNMLNGKSFEVAIDELSAELKTEFSQENSPALLQIYPSILGDIGSLFLFPTTTEIISNETANSEYDEKQTVTVKGHSTIWDESVVEDETNSLNKILHLKDISSNNIIKYGFTLYNYEFGQSPLGNTKFIDAEIVPLTYNNSKVEFIAKLENLERGKTYQYRAYTYDGTNRNYGGFGKFTINNYPKLTLSQTTLTLPAASCNEVKITSGSGFYKVKSSDPDVASVEIIGNTISINANTPGPATITVTDTKSGQTATIEVTVTKKVADLQLSAMKLTLVEGNSGTVSITAGSGEYGVTNLNSDIAKATLQGTTITIQALAAGEAKVVVTDMKTGQKIIIEVTVTQKAADLQLSATKLSLVEGSSGTVEITAGSGEYGVTNLNSDIAKATLQGTTITIQALAAGEAKVVVTDIKTGQKIIIEVTVTQGTTYPDIALSTQEVYLNVGDTEQIEVTSGSGSYSVWVYAPEVANVTISGKTITIKALSLGSTVVKVTDEVTQKTITFGIAVIPPSAYDKYAVDLGLSVKWAKMNVGAVSIEDCGEHYAWGETESKSYFSWSSYDYCNGNESTITKYNAHDGKTTLEPSDDAATVIMGRNWRTPTLTEMEELVNRCQWTPETLNGVNGVRVTGPNGNSIFLPYGGEMFDDVLSHDGAVGYYYASTLSSEGEKYAPALVCLGNKPEFVNYARYYGLSIRPVFNKK